MKKDFLAAFISLIVFWALMFILSILITLIRFSWIGGGPDAEAVRLFGVSFSVITSIASLCFPFLAVRIAFMLKKIDWSCVSIKAFSFWVLLILALHKVAQFAALSGPYQREFDMIRKTGTGNAAYVSDIVKMALIEICFLWIVFSIAAYRAKKKSDVSTVSVSGSPIQVSGPDSPASNI